MEFFVVLTLSLPLGGGVRQATIIRTVTAEPGSTRSGLLSWALKQAPAEMQSACILFFSAEPNLLPAGLKAVKG
jgi:hypothetical protein